MPAILPKRLDDPDPDRERADRVMQPMPGVVKLDIAALQAAYDGR